MLTGYPVEDEHARLLAGLRAMSQGYSSIHAVFEEILRIFQRHLDREEEIAIPLLKYLPRLVDGSFNENPEDLQRVGERFRQQYMSILEENRQIEELLSRIEDLPDFSQNADARDLSCALKHHAAMEEQVLFPAAIATIRLIG